MAKTTNRNLIRVINSVGRVFPSHGRSREFESLITHHKVAIKKISPQKALIFQGFLAFSGRIFLFNFEDEKWKFFDTK